MDANVYAAVAGDVGRPNDVGAVGIFRRPAAPGGQWQHVLPDLECHVVAVHPGDPAVVYAGTTDGVWRSTDHGASFRRTGFPDAGTQIWSVLVDAGNPDLVFAGASPVGVWRSTDRGATWRRLPAPSVGENCACFFPARVMRMAQRPGRPGEIFAAMEINGAMHSTDAGESWTDVSAGLIELSRLPHLSNSIVTDNDAEGMLDVHAVAICPADPDTVVLALRMGLFRSRDAGRSWQDMAIGRFAPTTYGRDIRVSPHDPRTFYAALSGSADSREGGVYRSTDAGATWSRFDRVRVNGTIMTVALDASDPARFFLGARFDGEVHGTGDGGATWEAMPLPGKVKDIFCLATG